VYDTDGQTHSVFGWYSTDHWGHIHPVVANPDGPGIGPWPHFHGEDPWRLVLA